LSGEPKAVIDRVKSFYDDLSKAYDGKDSSLAAIHKRVVAVEAAYLTAKSQAQKRSFNCHQYSPTLNVETPIIRGDRAEVTVLPIDLIDLYAEKTYSITLIKNGSQWMIDSINCPSFNA
jgi:hypothetical protein